MKKRLLSLLLLLSFLASLCIPAAAVDLNYTDKDEITYQEAVAVLSREGIISGFPDGSFRPGDTLTRAQACTILTRILRGSPDGVSSFRDVSAGAWYGGYVAYCAFNELVAGVGDGNFNPEGQLTGAAWSKMILTGLGYDAEETGMLGSGWQTGVANLASAEQLYAGIAGFDPSKPVTRDEACQITYNAMFDGEVPEPANDVLSQLSYSFTNSRKAFSYPNPYQIPMDIFRLVYGDEIKAEKMYEKFGNWGGNCYGMVSTAGILYQYGNGISPSDFNSRAAAPRYLGVTEVNPTWPLTLTQFIEALHVSQLTEEMNEVKSRNAEDLNGLCAAIMESRENGRAPVLICVWGDEGGHAIMGYDVLDVNDSEAYILVYDPNYPMEECYISLDKSGGSYVDWTYPISSDIIWSSKTDGEISYIPYTDYYQGWQNRKGSVITSDMLFMTVSDDAEIYDENGEAVANISGGSVTVYDSEAYPLRPIGVLLDEAGLPDTEVTLWLPGHGYSVRHTGEGEFTVELTEKEQTASVTTGAATVFLIIEDGSATRTVSIPADQQGASYSIDIRSSMEEDKGPSTFYLSGTVSGSGLRAGSEGGSMVTVGADPSRDTLYVDGEPVYVNGGGSADGGSSASGGTGPYDTGKGEGAPAEPAKRSGRGEQPAEPARKGDTVQLSVSKTVYAPEEPIVVSYSGVDAGMVNNNCWICVSDAYSAASSYKSGYKKPDVGSGTVTLNAPYDEGTYELRFYGGYSANDENLDDSTIIRFTVERPELTKNLSLSVAKTVFAPEEPIVVSYSGMTEWLRDHNAWICVSDRYSEAGSYKSGYKKPDVGSGTVTLTAPFDEGDYELRFYDSYSANDLNLVDVLTIPFTVKHSELTKDVSLSVTKTLFAPEEPIVVNYSGITEWLRDHNAWICVSDRFAKSGSYKSGYKKPDVGSGSVVLTAPFDEGDYELRFYDGYSANDLNRVARLTIPFTVKHSELTKDVSLSVTKTLFAPEEPIVVSYSGVTQWLVDHNAWICVSDRYSGSDNYKGGYKKPEVGSGTVTLTAPFDEGDYELRFYDGYNANDLNLVKVLTIPFTVKHSELTKNVSLSVPKTNYAPGEDIVVSYSGVTQWLVDHNAWICVSDRYSGADNYKSGYKKPGVGSGTVTLTAPKESGTYELRFYDGYSASDLNLASQLTIVITVG